ncbi:MAG TPA: hypothetical protein VER03_24240 [Bryobacteraceae bacterium]|nr:hypothetical protein [Bryobacteraceae bacterium]
MDRERQLQADAWIGDAVLALWARLQIVRTDRVVDGPKFLRMTSNQFLAAFGEPTAVEAQIGRAYRDGGEAAAFAWIEEKIAPLFARQEEKRLRGKGLRRGL